MPKMVSLRLDEELLEWADGYAKERGVSRTDVVGEALRSLREDSEPSVPDLPVLKEMTEPALKFARDVRSDAMARQAKLNKAKYG